MEESARQTTTIPMANRWEMEADIVAKACDNTGIDTVFMKAFVQATPRVVPNHFGYLSARWKRPARKQAIQASQIHAV